METEDDPIGVQWFRAETASRGFKGGSSIEIAARGLLAEINKGFHSKLDMRSNKNEVDK